MKEIKELDESFNIKDKINEIIRVLNEMLPYTVGLDREEENNN